jgi:serine/threonine-protein kinase
MAGNSGSGSGWVFESYPGARYIGGGGQKEVYAYEHEKFGSVVVKVGTFSNGDQFERIKREVELLKGLKSEYFPRQYSFRRRTGSRYVIIEERLDGDPLSTCIGEWAREEKAVWVVQHLAVGMLELWRQRVVHRDIKPANVIMSKEHPRIIDLGIARVLDATSLTMSFAPFGPCTPAYASPEQLTNQKRVIDHRADQFCLGVMLAELLLGGVHAFGPDVTGRGMSIPENIVNGIWAKDRLKECCSEQGYRVLSRMLGSEPYMRYRLAEELLEALEQWRGYYIN